MFKGIFFDFDETLFDHQHAAKKGLQAIGELYPILLSVPLEKLENELWRLMDWNYGRVLSKEISPFQARIERIEGLFHYVGAKPPFADLGKLADLYGETYRGNGKAIEGIELILKQLQREQYFLGIMTNGMKVGQTERLKGIGLEGYFQILVSSEEARSEKPDSGIFNFAMEKTGFQSEELLLIGDSWEKDMVGASRAGWHGIWLKRRAGEREANSWIKTARSVDELEKHLVEWGVI